MKKKWTLGMQKWILRMKKWIQDKKVDIEGSRRPADFLISYAALRKSWPAEKDKPPRERGL